MFFTLPFLYFIVSVKKCNQFLLILYLAKFISFSVESLAFSIYSTMLSAYNDNLTTSLPIWIPFTSYMIAVDRNSHSMMKRSTESGKWEDFQLFTIEYYIGCGFVINSFYYIEICFLCTHFCKFFLIMNACWILSNGFYASTEMIMCFFLFCWWVYHVDVHILKLPCDPGMTNLVVICDLFMCCWIWFANIFLRIFKSIFIKDNGL